MTLPDSHLGGRHCSLRPVKPADYGFLYDLEVTSSLGGMWRQQGRTPSPDEFAASLWVGVVASFIVQTTAGEPVGVVAFYDEHQRDGVVYLAALVGADHRRGPVGIEAVERAITHAFRSWPVRKIYMESLEPNYEQFRSGAGRWFTEEGRLRNFGFSAGRYWDKVILAVDRADWARSRSSGSPVEDLLATVLEILRVDELDRLALQADLVDDLGADSLTYFEVAEAIEAHHDIAIPDELIQSWRTVDDIVHYVAQLERPA